jgi:lipopolysaccharide/colanic/teichoic acid biosynthesis glycosyltransferase
VWAERLLALLMLIPALPVMGFLILLVRLTSRGPGVYRQVRVGKLGREYTMYKLRSMRLDAEADGAPKWTFGGDPRVTPLGYWLRKLHLDELPQLYNVLRGEMSLIGPRPERPQFVAVLATQLPGYLDRLAVLPGVTGLAQVNLPADTDLASVARKLVLDKQYIATAGVFMDVRILLCTALRVFGVPGRIACRMLRLVRVVPAEATEPFASAGDAARHCATPALLTVGATSTEQLSDSAATRYDDSHDIIGEALQSDFRKPR